MKNFLIGLAACAAAVLFLVHTPTRRVDEHSVPAINAIVGDASFRKAFGHDPDATTDEDLRIRTHLAYVLRELRAVPAFRVPAELRAARAVNLGRLERYIALGVFPRNPAGVGMHGRAPNFLDALGRICAVGYLVREDLGAGAVEEINARYQFARIADMESATLAAWQASSGLTLRELAMIQPEYCEDGTPGCGGVIVEGPMRSASPVPAIAAGLTLGANLAFTGVNAARIGRAERSTWLGIAGIGVGLAGLAISTDDAAGTPTLLGVTGGLAVMTGAIQLIRPRPTKLSEQAAPARRVQFGPIVRGGESLLAVQVQF